MRTLLASLLLSLGCNASATPPTYTRADAGLYDAPAAIVSGDALSDDAPVTGPACDAGRLGAGFVCGGVCVRLDDQINCGACGNACAPFQSCCADRGRAHCCNEN